MSQMIMLLWWHLKYCQFVTLLAMYYCFSLRGLGGGGDGEMMRQFLSLLFY